MRGVIGLPYTHNAVLGPPQCKATEAPPVLVDTQFVSEAASVSCSVLNCKFGKSFDFTMLMVGTSGAVKTNRQKFPYPRAR